MAEASSTPLRRSLGLSHATSMVAGTILGASIFVQPSEIGLHVPTAGGMMAVWALAGLLTLCGALVCAELSAAFPQTGGVYVFLRELFSAPVAFLWGWAMFWSVHSGIIAAMSMIAARYVGYFVPLGDFELRAVAIVFIFLLSAVNYTGVRAGSTLQLVLTAAKLLAIAAILILLFAFAPATEPMDAAPQAGVQVGWRAIALALVAGLFSYGGWHMVTYAAGETHEARQTIPRALLYGSLLVTLCYLAMNAAYLRVLPLEQVIGSARVAADAAERVTGAGGAGFISALVVVSTLGSLTGIILAGPRMYYAMARDGLAFRWMGAVHPQFQTPHRAIIAQAVWASVLVGTNTYRALFTRAIYTEWIFFALLAAGVILLRRREGATRVLPRWTVPLVPVAFIASSLLIVVNQLATDILDSSRGILLVIAGLPVYFLWARKRSAE